MDNFPALLAVSFTAYSLSLALHAAYALTRREPFAIWAHRSLWAAALLHAAALAAPMVLVHVAPAGPWSLPWGDWSGSLSLFAFLIALAYLAVRWLAPLPVLGVFVVPCSWLPLAAALLLDGGPSSPPAPGGEHWLAVHAFLLFLAYAAFANAFGVGGAYLIQARQLKSRHPSRLMYRLPPLEDMDRLLARLMAVGVPLLAAGLAVGARWAERAWVWDAKALGALSTLAIYAGALLLRRTAGWHGRRTALAAIAGFAVTLLTYLAAGSFSRWHGFLAWPA